MDHRIDPPISSSGNRDRQRWKIYFFIGRKCPRCTLSHSLIPRVLTKRVRLSRTCQLHSWIYLDRTHSQDIRIIVSTIREQVVIWLRAVYLLMLHEASHFHDSIKNMSSYTKCSKYTQNWRHTRSRSICWRASFCQEDRKGERNGKYPISHTRCSTRTISSFFMHSTFHSCSDSVTREPRAYLSYKRIDARSTITKTGRELEGTFSKPWLLTGNRNVISPWDLALEPQSCFDKS